jgi:hypothetical protein
MSTKIKLAFFSKFSQILNILSMICEKILSLTYEISRVSIKMLNNACLKCWFWSKTDKMGIILKNNLSLLPSLNLCKSVK